MRADLSLTFASLVLVLGSVAGCSGSTAEPSTTDSSRSATSTGPSDGVDRWRYAALGDSYTAAPFVPQTDLAEGCFRSTGNYPSLLADDLGITRVNDVSCGGADTDDIAGRQAVAGGRGTQPPQIRVVRPDSDLVTLGIGGNDENLFATLVQECTSLAEGSGTPCLDLREQREGGTADVLRRTTARVAGVLQLVHQRAPEARVVLVGYPRLVDPDRPCARIPLAPGDLPAVSALERDLRDALAAAADQGDAAFVDMYALSEGHEICSDDPWVNGWRTDESRALAYHPFAVEQRAAADAIGQVLMEDAS